MATTGGGPDPGINLGGAWALTGKAPPIRRQGQVRMVGRNDPCPCGSGRKYKHCCLGKSPRTWTRGQVAAVVVVAAAALALIWLW